MAIEGALVLVLFGPDGRESADVAELLQRVRATAKDAEVVDKIRFASDLKKAVKRCGHTGLRNWMGEWMPALV